MSNEFHLQDLAEIVMKYRPFALNQTIFKLIYDYVDDEELNRTVQILLPGCENIIDDAWCPLFNNILALEKYSMRIRGELLPKQLKSLTLIPKYKLKEMKLEFVQ